jgi:hypothetical protein
VLLLLLLLLLPPPLLAGPHPFAARPVLDEQSAQLCVARRRRVVQRAPACPGIPRAGVRAARAVLLQRRDHAAAALCAS